jgi:hypothetical protein
MNKLKQRGTYERVIWDFFVELKTIIWRPGENLHSTCSLAAVN